MTPALVVRDPTVLRPDPHRVIARQFLPGQEVMADGRSRVDAVITRVTSMTPEQAERTLGETVELFADRHDDLPVLFAQHYAPVAHRLEGTEVTTTQQALIGAYFTQEYALEAAALFNPSMVAHPDQTGLAAGELRVLMTVRSVGEGHVSSIQLRTGVVAAGGRGIVVDPAGRPRTGTHRAASLPRAVLLDALADRTGVQPDQVARLLPEQVDGSNFETVLRTVGREYFDRSRGLAVSEQLRWAFTCDYGLDFDPGHPLADAVLFPLAPDEGQGMEDARLTRFVEDDGTVTFYATYTAFDGSGISSHLIRTDDFRHVDVQQLLGPSAKSKGMAIFPRRVDGSYVALVRWDRESIGVARSDDLRRWGEAVTVQQPQQPWEIIQLGNCGPPIETSAGWLVLNHGVGPMRRYGIGALLLDLDDPTQLIGTLTEPLLLPEEDERLGYVPNVVYSCGALVHDDVLVLPYGCSDSSIRFAYVDLPALLDLLRPAAP